MESDLRCTYVEEASLPKEIWFIEEEEIVHWLFLDDTEW